MKLVNSEWAHTVLDIFDTEYIGEEAAKELLLLATEAHLRTDSERGHSLRIENVRDGVYRFEIPEIKYKNEYSNWFVWLDG